MFSVFSKSEKKKLISAISALIVLVLVFALRYFDTSRARVDTYDGSTDLEDFCIVHFINAGQGDSTLIETPSGKFALIDATTYEESTRVVKYLEGAGVEELEFVLFTHPHDDHIGGGQTVLESFKTNTVYMNTLTDDSYSYRYLTQQIEKQNITVINPKEDDSFYLDDIEFSVLSDGEGYDNTNSTSLCIKAQLGKSTFLFTGDAESDAERDLLRSGKDLSAVVFKAAHHGSSTSNTHEFLDAVNPDIAVISCGKDNMYGHPHDEVLSSLNERFVEVLRTDIDGDIKIAFDENSVIIL